MYICIRIESSSSSSLTRQFVLFSTAQEVREGRVADQEVDLI